MRVGGRPAILWVLLAVLGQLAVRAVIGGVALLMAPSGEIVGLSSVPLDRTPFGDFLVPGIILFVVFGLVPAVVCYALYTRRRWGWTSSVGVAVAMLIWVLVEVAAGFDRPTIYLNLATAGAIVVLAVHPAVRQDRSDAKRS
ncbi:hypothetical protein [Halapricum hydrolyticum]|uniref:Uncharacterized protein n=1 Tax=Halapricum hydrolyticum TaxID=2979991 RepID=A0AAE3IBZ1_9EURY|nr:hypothetical protein [Halapricum hydrolyticum]MCU4718085.1 hypothetical protein [Halapricum hydrolyticum]MCU4727407.1 hypothetical protein [Halapricum hydrolyticum]